MLRSRRCLVLTTAWSLVALQAVMSSAGSHAQAQPVEDFASRVTQEQERARLLAQGHASLIAGDAPRAREAIEQASRLRHAADAEVALVRAHMQAGEYRQALRIAGHSAAHLEYPEAAVLYARLLHLGGRPMVAAATSASSLQVAPQLGPFPVPAELVSAQARASGTGVLIDDGGMLVLAPLAAVQGARVVWVRNGLGQTATADIVRADGELGFALLRLGAPLPMARALEVSARPPFAGSAAAVVAYGSSEKSAPAWPEMRTSFLARAPAGQELAPVAIDAGAEGGPVFDATGRCIGFALPGRTVAAPLIGIDKLAAAAGVSLGLAAAGNAPRKTFEEVYEGALHVVVQVLREP